MSFAEDQGLKLVGYYQASPKLNESSFGLVGERMLANLRQSNPHTLGLLVRTWLYRLCFIVTNIVLPDPPG